MPASLLLDLRHLRQQVVRLALAPPSQDAQPQPSPAALAKDVSALMNDLARVSLDDRELAVAWGELQIMFVEADGGGKVSLEWTPLRNALNVAMAAALNREEWGPAREKIISDLLPKLDAAVNAPRSGRMQACMEVTHSLRTFADDPAFLGQRWRLLQIAGMEYPRFGTSGWRTRMGRDFTWPRARAVAQAIIEYVLSEGLEDFPLTVGYDSRINADQVAALVAEVAVAHGLTVHLAARETPSPALIHYITEDLSVAGNAGLINCTPSHNPVRDPETGLYLGSEYHGIRYNMPYGGVAPSRVTDGIGRRAMELLVEDPTEKTQHSRGSVTYFDPLESYAQAALKGLAITTVLPNGAHPDAIGAMRSYWGDEGALVIIDEMHSASRGYLRRVCDLLGMRYQVLHGEDDPLLGDLAYANPERPHTADLQRTIIAAKATHSPVIGVAFDTDSDRFGVVDGQGRYVMMNQLLSMLSHYLLTAAYSGQPGRIIRNMVTTRLLDRVAARFSTAEPGRPASRVIPPPDPTAIVPHAARPDYKVVLGDAQAMSGFASYVVPVGFKDIAEVMMQPFMTATTGANCTAEQMQLAFHECLAALLLAGEESNGMTSRAHTPDKDGLWGALLTLQMCAVTGKTLKALNEELWRDYGKLVSVRWDVEAPEDAKRGLVDGFLDACARPARTRALHHPDTPGQTIFPAGFMPIYCGGVRGDTVEVIIANLKGEECYLTIRASGTEPLNRVYVEAPEEADRDAILHAVVQQLSRLTGISSESLLQENPIYSDRWTP